MANGLLDIMSELSWRRVREPQASDLWEEFVRLRGEVIGNVPQQILDSFLDCFCFFPETAVFLQNREREAVSNKEARHLWNCLREKAVTFAGSSAAYLGWLSAHPAKPIV
ncbi:MAG: hypothetical protein WC757_02005 [Candidatus Paceibacterota bacterium]|jgi:hypothetical protein